MQTQHLAISHRFLFQKREVMFIPENIKHLAVCHFILFPDVYHRHRLEMGIPEGVDEIPVGKGLPLEYNLDYMNGGKFMNSLSICLMLTCCVIQR